VVEGPAAIFAPSHHHLPEGKTTTMRTLSRACLSSLVLTAVAGASVAASTPASATTATAKKNPTITVMVTNDDGVGAPGIDTLVEALRKEKNTKVVVVAPATNQSGTGGKTTPGALTTAAATTASGYQATAVQGYPADTVTAALDQLKVKPNVVMSGINAGQNLGTVVDLSGTIGAARAAATRGIPALALGQGLGDAPQFPSAAKLAVAWLADHRAALAKKPKTPLTTIDAINVPNCPSGKPRGVKHVQTATTSDNAVLATVDCSAAVTNPTTDIEAFNAGWAAEAPVSVTPAAG
jgi:5'-nucleotidase